MTHDPDIPLSQTPCRNTKMDKSQTDVERLAHAVT